MYVKMKKCIAILMSVAILSSLIPWMATSVDTSAATTGQSTEKDPSLKSSATVTAKNSIGDISLEQTKLNETNLALTIAGVNEILAETHADRVRVTAKMYYQDTVTQNVTKTIPLSKDQSQYTVDLKNFGKYTVSVEYL